MANPLGKSTDRTDYDPEDFKDNSVLDYPPKDDSDFDVFDFTEPNYNSYTTKPRSFKCPNCQGDINSWSKESKSVTQRKSEKAKCPFCGLEKYSYEPDEQSD